MLFQLFYIMNSESLQYYHRVVIFPLNELYYFINITFVCEDIIIEIFGHINFCLNKNIIDNIQK